MDNKQKIHCTVKSCRYNNIDGEMCSLAAIMVTPTPNNNSKRDDESMCSSYQHQK